MNHMQKENKKSGMGLAKIRVLADGTYLGEGE